MANLFSGISDFLSGGQMSDALGKLSRSSDQINAIKTPDLSSLIPELKLQVQQGTMTPASAAAAAASMVGSMSPASMNAVMAAVQGEMSPAQAQAFFQADSGMNAVQSDQGSLQGQRQALNQLADIADNQGMTEADRAQLAAVMNQTNANAAQQRAAQIQQLQMQGNAGSGAELAARLSGVQGAANQNAAAGADVAKAAQARALQAIQAGLAGNANLNTQMFEQAAQKAKAQDLVNQFNAQAKNTVGLQNAANLQQSNLANFNTANQVALANAQAQNAAAAQNAQFQQGASQQNFSMANQIAMANAANQQAANMANAGYANQANAANFGMANQIAGTNVGIMNQQAMLPYNAAQADFTNQLNKGVAGSTADYRAGSVMADLAGKQMANTTGQLDAAGNFISGLTGGKGTGGLGNVLGEGVKAIGNSDWWGSLTDTVGDWFGSLSDENLKTDKRELSDADIDQVMGHLTGYKYRYKGPKTNPTQMGVMAQDLEKGMPSSVVDTPAGKMVQKPEAMNMALAALANQHQRIKKLENK